MHLTFLLSIIMYKDDFLLYLVIYYLGSLIIVVTITASRHSIRFIYVLSLYSLEQGFIIVLWVVLMYICLLGIIVQFLTFNVLYCCHVDVEETYDDHSQVPDSGLHGAPDDAPAIK